MPGAILSFGAVFAGSVVIIMLLKSKIKQVELKLEI